jgi:hypothetical protein
MPIIKARREAPQDDLVSVLVQAELTEADGTRHTLSDNEVLGFAFLLLAAGSGTTWKQMGITLVALLQHPEWLQRLQQDPSVMRAVIEESVRWMPRPRLRDSCATTRPCGAWTCPAAVIRMLPRPTRPAPGTSGRVRPGRPCTPPVRHRPHACLGARPAPGFSGQPDRQRLQTCASTRLPRRGHRSTGAGGAVPVVWG